MISKFKQFESKYLDKLLEVNYENRNIFQIFFWWETRRFFYNFVIIIFGIICLTIISFLVNVPDGEDLIEPFAIFGFIFLCNFGYTFGWVIELFRRKNKTFAPIMFKFGLNLTMSVIMLPLIIHIILWIIRGFKTMY
jgi:hypothetical protein